MGFLDYLIPQTMQHQRNLARDRFQTAVRQPEMFQMENAPLTPQMRSDYQQGWNVPYPTQQMPSPTAPIEGMTTDPNRGTTIQPPENLPVEFVQPRSLEESTLRQSGIQGRAGAEKTLSGLEHYGQGMPRMEGFFEDVGEDIGDYDIPASVGQFQRNEPTEPGESYSLPQWDEKSGQYRYYEQTTGEPRWGGKGFDPSAGGDPEEKQLKEHMDSYKAITGKVGRIDPALAMLMGQMGSSFFGDPSNVQQLQGILTPMEQRIVQMNLQYMENHFRNQTGANDPMGIR
jgi:hypothetical protein